MTVPADGADRKRMKVPERVAEVATSWTRRFSDRGSPPDRAAGPLKPVTDRAVTAPCPLLTVQHQPNPAVGSFREPTGSYGRWAASTTQAADTASPSLIGSRS